MCAAAGVVLLNFDAVAAYIVYVISMLIQPKELIQASHEIAPIPLPPTQKRKFSIFNPFIRIYTLFVVLFLPNIDVEKLTGKKSKRIAEVQVNVYSEKTQEEVNKYHIKTYSVPSTDNLKTFRNSIETGAPLSSPFQQAFPDVVNILHKINKFENPEDKRPAPPLEIPENNMNDTFAEFTAYDSRTSNVRSELPKQESIPVAIPKAPVLLTKQAEEINLPVNPLPEKPKMPPIHSSNSKFDAIAALEKKVSALKNDTPKSSAMSNTKNVNVKVDKQELLPKLLIKKQDALPEGTPHVFKNTVVTTIMSLNILPLIGKILLYTMLSLPLLIVIGSIGYYLATVGFNLGKIAGYPGWASSSLESLVKTYIIKS